MWGYWLGERIEITVFAVLESATDEHEILTTDLGPQNKVSFSHASQGRLDGSLECLLKWILKLFLSSV